MARTPAGILGRTSGAIANVVGASWKGISYIRERVTPANPRSPMQTANRRAMALCTAWAKTLVIPVLNPFMDRRVRKMSGFNFVIQRNIDVFRNVGTALDIPDTPHWGDPSLFRFNQKFQITRGSLPNFILSSAIFDDESFSFDLQFRIESARLLKTDYVYVCWSDLTGGHAAFKQQIRFDGVNASDGSVATNIVGSDIFVSVVPTEEIFEQIKEMPNCLCNIFVLRFNNPDTMDFPINVSRDRNCVFDGTLLAPPINEVLEAWLDQLEPNFIQSVLQPALGDIDARSFLRSRLYYQFNDMESWDNYQSSSWQQNHARDFYYALQKSENINISNSDAAFPNNAFFELRSNVVASGQGLRIILTPEMSTWAEFVVVFSCPENTNSTALVYRINVNSSQNSFPFGTVYRRNDDVLLYLSQTWYQNSNIQNLRGTKNRILINTFVIYDNAQTSTAATRKLTSANTYMLDLTSIPLPTGTSFNIRQSILAALTNANYHTYYDNIYGSGAFNADSPNFLSQLSSISDLYNTPAQYVANLGTDIALLSGFLRNSLALSRDNFNSIFNSRNRINLFYEANWGHRGIYFGLDTAHQFWGSYPRILAIFGNINQTSTVRFFEFLAQNAQNYNNLFRAETIDGIVYITLRQTWYTDTSLQGWFTAAGLKFMSLLVLPSNLSNSTSDVTRLISLGTCIFNAQDLLRPDSNFLNPVAL